MYKMTLAMLALFTSNTLFAQTNLSTHFEPQEQFAQYMINAPVEGNAMTELHRNKSSGLRIPIHLFRVLPLDEIKRYAVPGGDSSIDLLITSYDRMGSFDLMESRHLWAVRFPVTVSKPESFAEMDERLDFLLKIPKGKWTLSELNPTHRSFVSSEIGKCDPLFNRIYYDRNDQYHLYWGIKGLGQRALLEEERSWFKSFEK